MLLPNDELLHETSEQAAEEQDDVDQDLSFSLANLTRAVPFHIDMDDSQCKQVSD